MHSAYDPVYNPPQKPSRQIHRGACKNDKNQATAETNVHTEDEDSSFPLLMISEWGWGKAQFSENRIRKPHLFKAS